ncbi:MAG TPA: hypothetical protein RMH99_19850 [Sandaracinaceae bacterium LLY-WYZ-13_1]|nr:hypothetical protein [Sandaracinaceae bacterium LLY-WYZ-13_1]
MKPARLILATALLLAGCDDTPPSLQPDGAPPGETPTYWRDVAPLVQRECLTCHVEGGIGPVPLDGYENLERHAASVVDAVRSGYMPPWMPDRECREFENQRGLSTEEREVFARWFAGGTPEGDPADAPAPPAPPPTLEVTHVARMAEPYVPDATTPDDYRCFILDHEFTEDSFLVGRNVIPDQTALVHHVLTYAVPPELVPMIEAADAAADGPGYTCFGGPVPSDDGGEAGTLGLISMGGWVPGAVPHVERPGRGVYVPGGSRLVMQVHYNLLSAEPAPDMTEYHMALTTEEPERRTTTFPTAITDLNIPAGMPDVREARTFRNYRSEPIEITGLTPHMHLLGTRIGMRRVPSVDGSGVDECLIDVPRWDFNWQEGYALREDDVVRLMPGEGLELTCEYDNSPSNQPVVNGEQVEPRDVSWGEGTLDEMCLLYVQHEEDWTGPPALDCSPAADCLASCATSDAECLLACEEVGSGCRPCALQATLGCAQDSCLAAYAPAGSCIQSCIMSYVLLGGSFARCMETECPSAWPGVRDCVAGVVDAGTCDGALTECGVSR